VKRTRELTAAVLMPLVLSLLVWGPLWSWALLVGLACGAALREFQDLVTRAGFTDVRAVPLTFGIVYLYTARK